MATLVRAHWEMFDGEMASKNIDLMGLPIDRFFSLVYYWATRNAEEKDRKKFDAQLWIPPKGVEPPPQSPWSVESESKALAAFATEVGQ